MVESKEDKERKETKTMPPTMATVKLDSGCSYDAPPEVVAELEKVRKERDDLKERADSVTKARDTLQGEHDALKKEKEELEKKDTAKDIAEAAKARVSLLRTTGEMVDKETAEKLDDMSDAELRIAAIKSTDKDFDAEGKSDEYIIARFDAAVGISEKSGSKKKAKGEKVIGTGTSHTDEDDNDPDAARTEMQNRRDGVKKKDTE